MAEKESQRPHAVRAQSGVGPSDAADEEHLQSEGGPANTIHDLLHGLRGVAALIWPWLSLIVFSIVLTNVEVFRRRHHDVFMHVTVISGLKTCWLDARRTKCRGLNAL